MIRTMMVNIFLILWILKNKSALKQKKHYRIIMEDRYVVLPSLVAALFFRIKLTSRISDWGREYVLSFPHTSPLVSVLFYLYGLIYQTFVLKASDRIIVPSRYIADKISLENQYRVFTFPYCLKIQNSDLIERREDKLFEDVQHDIYCLLVGNFNYPPNKEAARYVIETLSKELYLRDKKIKLVIVGPGVITSSSEKIPDNVSILGEVVNLFEVYKRCQIGINPSLTMGGLSVKIVEYLVNGLFVVSTTQSAIGIKQTTRLISSDRVDFHRNIILLANKIRSRDSVNNMNGLKQIIDYYTIDNYIGSINDFLS